MWKSLAECLAQLGSSTFLFTTRVGYLDGDGIATSRKSLLSTWPEPGNRTSGVDEYLP